MKYSKSESVLLEHFDEQKSPISEEWSFSIVQHVRILYFTLVVKV